VPRVVQAVAERAPTTSASTSTTCRSSRRSTAARSASTPSTPALKAALNPGDGRPSVAGFHVGDRVMQTRNDPELDVANGDVGTSSTSTPREGELRVAFPRGEVTYDREQARDLTRRGR
jgi:exodeoxyribonuclease V alpha subunit